ncbi:hypothetical protein [Fusobacterium sp. PH5-44]|uniref:hypothetical protein n=1 Tax=unclassified Fusobacterium TaxID=2648384 RepID=UPI003D24E478
MINFQNINQMIENIENNVVPNDLDFNSFMKKFFIATKLVPLAKYLRSIEKTNQLPKIIYAKKAGEFIIDTENNQETLTFLKRKGYSSIPQLSFKSILLLRKIDNISNWKKIITLIEGKGTVDEINRTTRPALLPNEVQMLETFLIEKLSISEKELNWLLTKFMYIDNNKKLYNAFRKLLYNLK